VNLFDATIPLQDETFSTLLEHKNVKIVRIVSSSNLEVCEYLQREDEWVVVVQGKANILTDNQEKTLYQGDSLFIPSQTKHSVQSVEDGTIWLAIHIY